MIYNLDKNTYLEMLNNIDAEEFKIIFSKMYDLDLTDFEQCKRKVKMILKNPNKINESLENLNINFREYLILIEYSFPTLITSGIESKIKEHLKNNLIINVEKW